MIVKTINSTFEESSKAVLEESIAENFETVIVFGFKNGLIYTKNSRAKSRLEVMGALMAAIDHINHQA